MSHCRRKSLLRNLKGFMRTSPMPWMRVLPPKFSTATSTLEKQYFRMKYLVNRCGFSPETASELSKQVTFLDSRIPDAVLQHFRDLNISDSGIRNTIVKVPALISSNPVTNLSPKLEFFKSRGASTFQLAQMLTTNPRLFRNGLKTLIIPSYELMKRFLHSDLMTISSIARYPNLMTTSRTVKNVNLLLDYGVSESSIALLLRFWPLVLSYQTDKVKKKVDEVKEWGFIPSKTSFLEALRVKLFVRKSSWERKVELFRRWGWSDETLHKAFSKRPSCMLIADSKIEAVMQFFVNQMGWDSSVLAEYPILLALSLEKRIIPRASVVRFLQSGGLIEKHASAVPFRLVEEMFLKRFVNNFKNEAPQLLNLYEEKLNLSR